MACGRRADGRSHEVLWVCGNRGTLLRTTDRGENFELVPTGSTQTIFVIEYDPSTGEFLIAGVDTLLRTVGGSQLMRVAGNFEGRFAAGFFDRRTEALWVGGDRLIRIGR